LNQKQRLLKEILLNRLTLRKNNLSRTKFLRKTNGQY